MPLGDLEDLVRTALECGLIGPEARRTLMRGLPMGFVYSLPTVSRPIDQLRFDLMELERTPRLIGLDRPPLAVWLSNAADKTATEGKVDAARLFAQRADAIYPNAGVAQRIGKQLGQASAGTPQPSGRPTPTAAPGSTTSLPKTDAPARAYVLTLDSVEGEPWTIVDPPIEPIRVLPVRLPGGAWAHTARPYTLEWRQVRDGIDTELDQLAQVIQRGDVLAVFMRGLPLAMAMLLGSRLRQRRFSAAVVRYFERVRVRGRNGWHLRGPWPHDVAPAETPVLLRRDTGLSDKTREVAVLVQIGARIPPEPVEQALAGMRIDTRLVLSHRNPGRGALAAPPDIERALQDLVDGVEHLRARASRLRHLHFFYRGPVPLAARIADELLECGIATTVYAEHGDRFIPAVELSPGADATLIQPPAAEVTPSGGFDVFLSFARADEAVAVALHGILETDRGYRVFLDRSSLQPGDTWDTAIPDALAKSQLVVALLAPVGNGPGDAWYQKEEIIAGIRNSRHSEGARRVVPVLLDGLQPEDVPFGLGRLTTIGPCRGTPIEIARQIARELEPILPSRAADPDPDPTA